jgi:hypothetical protein
MAPVWIYVCLIDAPKLIIALSIRCFNKKFDTTLVRRMIEKVILLSFLYFIREVEVELASR